MFSIEPDHTSNSGSMMMINDAMTEASLKHAREYERKLFRPGQ